MGLLERVYFFHGEITRNRYPNARTLVREFEISLSTARRDLAYLRDRLLAPLAYNAIKNGFYYTDNTFNLPFENSPRIIFLLGMLNRLAEETGLSNLPEIRQLEKRLSAMLAEEDYALIKNVIHCEWIEVEYPKAAIVDTIIDAIVQHHQLSILYCSPVNDTTERTVEPHKLINYQGRWYLSAWCTLRNEPRIFHIARISKATIGDKPCDDAKVLPIDLEQSFGIFKGPSKDQAKILFTGKASELVKNQVWHKNQTIENSEGGTLLCLPFSDDREIVMKILQYGAMARVISPRRLADTIHQEGRNIAELYQQTGKTEQNSAPKGEQESFVLSNE